MSRYGDWIPRSDAHGTLYEWMYKPTSEDYPCDANGWISSAHKPPLSDDGQSSTLLFQEREGHVSSGYYRPSDVWDWNISVSEYAAYVDRWQPAPVAVSS